MRKNRMKIHIIQSYCCHVSSKIGRISKIMSGNIFYLCRGDDLPPWTMVRHKLSHLSRWHNDLPGTSLLTKYSSGDFPAVLFTWLEASKALSRDVGKVLRIIRCSSGQSRRIIRYSSGPVPMNNLLFVGTRLVLFELNYFNVPHRTKFRRTKFSSDKIFSRTKLSKF